MTYRVFERVAKYTTLEGVESCSRFFDWLLRDQDDEAAVFAEWERGMRQALEEKKGTAIECIFTERPTRRTWALTWFGHMTFRCPEIPDAGAALASFEKYVRSAEHDPEICLMGAEDRWRWRGENPGDPAPCECRSCVDLGIWRIDH